MKNIRAILLNPPTAASSTEPFLSLAYLAAVLRQAGHQVKIIDATAPYKTLTEDDVAKEISDFKPDFIGISLTVGFISQTYRYIQRLRKLNIPIIAGGPHANCLPEEVLAHGTDIVVIGEGENTIVELADYYLSRRSLETINGLCYRNAKGNVTYTASRAMIKDLDTIPFPDRDDFPIENYTGSSDPSSNPLFWGVFSSRGCPFNCIFCSSHNVFGRSARLRSASNVFEEIKGIADKYGTKTLTFQDDEILCSKKRFIELCNLIIESGLKLKMSLRTRIDSIDAEVLEKAFAAGITRLSFGIESFNDDTLKKINKMYNTAKIKEKFKVLADAGYVNITFNNIWGFPWENSGHYESNLKEIISIPAEIPFFTNVVMPIPFPGTKLYSMYDKEYSFTDWWLDDNKHEKYLKKTNVPFYIKFAFDMHPLHRKDLFWNYDKKKRKEINKYCWKLFKIFMARHFAGMELLFVIYMSRISYFISGISPGIELMLLSRLTKSNYIAKLKGRLRVYDKY